MGVFPDVNRAVDLLRCTKFAKSLGDGKNVSFGERAVERGAAMAAGAEGDQLTRFGEIRFLVVIVALEFGDVDEETLGGRFAGQWADGHQTFLSRLSHWWLVRQ